MTRAAYAARSIIPTPVPSGRSRLLFPGALRLARRAGARLALGFGLGAPSGLLLAGLFGRRSRRRSLDQLHQRHRRGVSRTWRHAEDPGIAARTRLEARPEVSEELLDHLGVA